MVPGVAEAVKKMVVGERRRVWVPAALTVRKGGDEPRPGEDATFDVELVEVIRAPSLPSDLTSPPRGAMRMESGLIMKVLRPGTGTAHPGPRSRVKLDFSGWTTDGKLIGSSVMAHHPARFEMVGVIRGWREALLTMVQGRKVRLWIPASLAYGAKPRRGQPKGDLVYDLEVLAIDP
jgi:peptidylprolyl isomerase